MDNQHRKIKGYRELNQQEIDLMNKVKSMGIELGELVQELSETGQASDDPEIDQRWVAIGKTHMQQGLMALTRSIARPGFF